MKSNSNLAVIQLLAQRGAGVDVVSGGELFRALKAGVSPEKIVFSGVGKTADEISQALLCGTGGIYSFNVESLQELAKINQVAAKLGKTARVALRFNPDIDAKTHPYISTGLRKNKFGLDKKEILAGIQQLENLPHIQIKGLSIHIGSQILSPAPLKAAYKKLKELVAQVDGLLKTPLEFVDLGGGFGVSYSQKQKSLSAESMGKTIRGSFGKDFKKRILIEPGRILSANAGVLLTQVLYRKPKKSGKDFLIVDAGMNDLIRPALYQSHHPIIPLEQKLHQGAKAKTNVVGPVCESADCFDEAAPLSRKLGEGDYLAILSAGAYGFTMASSYNSRPRPAEVLLSSAKESGGGNDAASESVAKLIRARETHEDLVRGENSDMPGFWKGRTHYARHLDCTDYTV